VTIVVRRSSGAKSAAMLGRFMFPNVLAEPPQIVAYTILDEE
jgi:hypothetical protein